MSSLYIFQMNQFPPEATSSILNDSTSDRIEKTP